MTTYELRIYGRVQGVGFRYFVQKEAEKLGLKGYVKNNYDGSVSIKVSGESEKIKELEKKCKIGNSLSKVERIEKQEVPFVKYEKFFIKI